MFPCIQANETVKTIFIIPKLDQNESSKPSSEANYIFNNFVTEDFFPKD